MDEKTFKKHLADLAHGHHHPEEHDWSSDSNVPTRVPASRTKTKKAAASKTRRAKGH